MTKPIQPTTEKTRHLATEDVKPVEAEPSSEPASLVLDSKSTPQSVTTAVDKQTPTDSVPPAKSIELKVEESQAPETIKNDPDSHVKITFTEYTLLVKIVADIREFALNGLGTIPFPVKRNIDALILLSLTDEEKADEEFMRTQLLVRPVTNRGDF